MKERQQKADDFHIDHLKREHDDILRIRLNQIHDKEKRLKKLKKELSQFKEELSAMIKLFQSFKKEIVEDYND